MNIQVLIATMNQSNPASLKKNMHVNSCFIVNQITERGITPTDTNSTNLVTLSVREEGLSKSRNLSLSKTNADIAVVADDDMIYEDSYEQTITEGFRKHSDADILIFRVDNADGSSRQVRPGRIGYLRSMKACSVQMAYQPRSIQAKGLSFDVHFGVGTSNHMGEENIFLIDCLRAGLKVYSYPIKIATLTNTVTTGARNLDENYFRVKGRVFRRMSRPLAPLLSLQFAIRKRSMYKNTTSFSRALKLMLSDKVNNV